MMVFFLFLFLRLFVKKSFELSLLKIFTLQFIISLKHFNLNWIARERRWELVIQKLNIFFGWIYQQGFWNLKIVVCFFYFTIILKLHNWIFLKKNHLAKMILDLNNQNFDYPFRTFTLEAFRKFPFIDMISKLENVNINVNEFIDSLSKQEKLFPKKKIMTKPKTK